LVSVNVVDGEVLHITKVSRLHLGAYLCIASNSVPPSMSKRVLLRVQCKYSHAITNVSISYIQLAATQSLQFNMQIYFPMCYNYIRIPQCQLYTFKRD